jgi:hypothetical protein
MDSSRKSLIIAVDFDGTIVDDAYPNIGPYKPFAVQTLKLLHSEGHRLILWTYRRGKFLRDAVDLLEKSGVELYAVNASFPGENDDLGGYSRKIHADLFVDDRNVGGFPGWGEVYRLITQEQLPQKEMSNFRNLWGWVKPQ